ncbi:MAG TPA: hypothetical protein VET45_08045 [Candidatus Binatia bacterium]|nr:hypothetical protein [Candidatus Binatia bacterium]
MQSEVLALERRNVDLAAGTLRLDPGSTKNGAGRVVYLTPEIHRLLTDQLGRVDELQRELKRIIPHVFPHPAGSPRLKGTRRRDFRKAWARRAWRRS